MGDWLLKISRKIDRRVAAASRPKAILQRSLIPLSKLTVLTAAVTSSRNWGTILPSSDLSQVAFESVGKSSEKTLAK